MPAEEKLQHLLLEGLPSKGTVRASFSLARSRETKGQRIQIHRTWWGMSSPKLVHLKITMHNYYNWCIAVISGMIVCVAPTNELLSGVQTLPLDFYLQDVSRSGDREIWHTIKEIVPKWSAHTYHVLSGTLLSICRSLGATANRVPKLHWAKNRHEFNHLYWFVRSERKIPVKAEQKGRNRAPACVISYLNHGRC